MILEPFDIPDEVILDLASGLAVNIPAINQGDPFWWEDQPDVLDRIMKTRERLGIVIEDFPDGRPIRQEETLFDLEEMLAGMSQKDADYIDPSFNKDRVRKVKKR